jgi:hypothetical protein
MTTSLKIGANRWSYLCLFLFLPIAGCASDPQAGAPVARPGLGIEQVLRLPVTKGHAGVDEVVHAIQALYGVDTATQLPPSNNVKSPITLADGTVLVQALTDPRLRTPKWNELAIEVTEKPCFPIENAAALIGAKKMAESAGDGVGHAGSIEYSFNNSGVRIDLTASHPGPHCLRTVWMYKNAVQKSP